MQSSIHLYVIMHPNYALVASMLEPKQFGKHYALGSSRYFHGQVLFAEIDAGFRHEYFPIDRMLEDVKPKPDGTPKRTKFISTYRVLEHIDLAAFRNLYLVSVEGAVLEIEQKRYEREHQPGFIRTFQEICPIRMVVLSYMSPPEFGAFITDPDQSKGAPKVCFTQIDFDIEQFFRQLEENPFHSSPVPNVHSHKLRDQILELRANPYKRVKGISLDSAFGQISPLKLRGGFWIAEKQEFIFYPMPDRDTLRKDHYEWFRSIT